MKTFGSKRRGFTMVEVMLTIILLSVLSLVTARIMVEGLNMYTFIIQREMATQGARMAMERMKDEITAADPTNFYAIEDSRFGFWDWMGYAADFRSGRTTLHGRRTPVIFRQNNVLLENLDQLDFGYYRFDRTETTMYTDVRFIKVEFTTNVAGQPEPYHLRTTIFPRKLMYNNYN